MAGARVALTDPLTGLVERPDPRRASSSSRSPGRSARGPRSRSPLFDVDGFRELNEPAGARAGDRACARWRAVLAETVRLVDTVGRTGGDEFVLVAPGSAGVTVATP